MTSENWSHISTLKKEIYLWSIYCNEGNHRNIREEQHNYTDRRGRSSPRSEQNTTLHLDWPSFTPRPRPPRWSTALGRRVSDKRSTGETGDRRRFVRGWPLYAGQCRRLIHAVWSWPGRSPTLDIQQSASNIPPSPPLTHLSGENIQVKFVRSTYGNVSSVQFPRLSFPLLWVGFSISLNFEHEIQVFLSVFSLEKCSEQSCTVGRVQKMIEWSIPGPRLHRTW